MQDEDYRTHGRWRWRITFGRSPWSAVGGQTPYPYAHVLHGSVVKRVFRFIVPRMRARRYLNKMLADKEREAKGGAV